MRQQRLLYPLIELLAMQFLVTNRKTMTTTIARLTRIKVNIINMLHHTLSRHQLTLSNQFVRLRALTLQVDYLNWALQVCQEFLSQEERFTSSSPIVCFYWQGGYALDGRSWHLTTVLLWHVSGGGGSADSPPVNMRAKDLSEAVTR